MLAHFILLCSVWPDFVNGLSEAWPQNICMLSSSHVQSEISGSLCVFLCVCVWVCVSVCECVHCWFVGFKESINDLGPLSKSSVFVGECCKCFECWPKLLTSLSMIPQNYVNLHHHCLLHVWKSGLYGDISKYTVLHCVVVLLCLKREKEATKLSVTL